MSPALGRKRYFLGAPTGVPLWLMYCNAAFALVFAHFFTLQEEGNDSVG